MNSTEKQVSAEGADDGIGEHYLRIISGLLDRMVRTQRQNIEAAASMFVEATARDKLIHVYGVGGHSYVGSEEFFYRAGGLANINPLFELSLSLAAGGQKSTLLERTQGIGDKIVRAHNLGPHDLLVITSAYGINACSIDAALEARRRRCRVIAITSVEFAMKTPRDFPARHTSGASLHEIADVTIDNHVPYGEVVIELPGFEQGVGGTCNILQCFAINWLVSRTAELLLAKGLTPPIWRSANVAGGDTYNQQLLARYSHRVKAL